MQNVQGDAAGAIRFLPYVPGKNKREDWCMPTGPTAGPRQMAAGKYRSYGGKVSLFTLLLVAYSSPVIMRGTGYIFQVPDRSAVGIFPQNPSNFPFNTLRLEEPGISTL